MPFKIHRPDQPKQDEHKIQVNLMAYLAIAGRKDLHWFAVPNGGFRTRRTASRLKAEGVRAGTPDLCFMLEDGKVAWLEMKTEKGRLGPAQIAFRDIANRLGHRWAQANSLDQAIEHLREWGVLKPTSPTIFTTDHLASIKHQPKEQNRGTQA